MIYANNTNSLGKKSKWSTIKENIEVVLVARKMRRREVNTKKTKDIHDNFSSRKGSNYKTAMTSKISYKKCLRMVLLKSSVFNFSPQIGLLLKHYSVR